jgi:hypothetical protein
LVLSGVSRRQRTIDRENIPIPNGIVAGAGKDYADDGHRHRESLVTDSLKFDRFRPFERLVRGKLCKKFCAAH